MNIWKPQEPFRHRAVTAGGFQTPRAVWRAMEFDNIAAKSPFVSQSIGAVSVLPQNIFQIWKGQNAKPVKSETKFSANVLRWRR